MPSVSSIDLLPSAKFSSGYDPELNLADGKSILVRVHVLCNTKHKS